MKNTFQIMMLIIRIRIKFPQMTLNCIKLISLMRLLNNKIKNQSIDEDNFNNQSNESEQLEQNEAIEQSNETSDENAQNVESTKTNDSHRLSTNSSENTYKLSIKDRVKEFNDNRKRKKHAKSTQFDHLSPQERKEQLRIQRRKRQKEFSTLSLHFSIINNFILLYMFTPLSRISNIKISGNNNVSNSQVEKLWM